MLSWLFSVLSLISFTEQYMKNCQAGIVWDGKVATISESADLQSDAMHKL